MTNGSIPAVKEIFHRSNKIDNSPERHELSTNGSGYLER
jgi:hypothetical protein